MEDTLRLPQCQHVTLSPGPNQERTQHSEALAYVGDSADQLEPSYSSTGWENKVSWDSARTVMYAWLVVSIVNGAVNVGLMWAFLESSQVVGWMYSPGVTASLIGMANFYWYRFSTGVQKFGSSWAWIAVGLDAVPISGAIALTAVGTIGNYEDAPYPRGDEAQHADDEGRLCKGVLQLFSMVLLLVNACHCFVSLWAAIALPSVRWNPLEVPLSGSEIRER